MTATEQELDQCRCKSATTSKGCLVCLVQLRQLQTFEESMCEALVGSDGGEC